MSYGSQYDCEIYVNGRKVVAADPHGDAAKSRLGGGLLGHDACLAPTRPAFARLSAAGKAAVEASARMAQQMGSAPGELEAWEAARGKADDGSGRGREKLVAAPGRAFAKLSLAID